LRNLILKIWNHFFSPTKTLVSHLDHFVAKEILEPSKGKTFSTASQPCNMQIVYSHCKSYPRHALLDLRGKQNWNPPLPLDQIIWKLTSDRNFLGILENFCFCLDCHHMRVWSSDFLLHIVGFAALSFDTFCWVWLIGLVGTFFRELNSWMGNRWSISFNLWAKCLVLILYVGQKTCGRFSSTLDSYKDIQIYWYFFLDLKEREREAQMGQIRGRWEKERDELFCFNVKNGFFFCFKC
jgi:hypothetical protein